MLWGSWTKRRCARRRTLAAFLATLTVTTLLGVMPARAAAATGRARAWGSNSNGQLGVIGAGGTTLRDVTLPASASAISGGGRHTLAVVGGTVYAWGSNFYGQLGRGGLAPGGDSPTPESVVGLSNVVRIAAGTDHSLALTSDGNVWAWGSNVSAQLALNPQTIGRSSIPVKVEGVADVVEIAAGASHSLARTADGRVYGWGSNVNGQLGIGPVLKVVPTPTQITDLPRGATTIAAGANHSLAVLQDGSVFAWGDNTSNQLNDPDTAGRMNPSPIDTGVDARTVAAGARHSYALRADGTIVSWGSDDRGQLGRDGSSAPAALSLDGVTKLVSGAAHALAVVSTPGTATIYSWGDNSAGQLGRGSAGGIETTPGQVAGVTTTVLVGAGDEHSLALVAPKATLSADLITFPGVIEVGRRSAPRSVTLTNQGPGSLAIGAVRFEELQQDFAFAPNGDGCSGRTLARDASCSIAVEFAPQAAGPRSSHLTIASDGFDGTLTVQLSGVASIVAGSISITTQTRNLTEGVPASPSKIALNDIPLQPHSPATEDAVAAGELELSDVTGIGEFELSDVTGIGEFELSDVTGIGEFELSDVTGIGELVLSDVTQIAPAAKELLKQITISGLPLAAPYRWQGEPSGGIEPILFGTSLASVPLQQVTLFDVLADPAAAARLREVPIDKVGWTSSKLGSLGVIGVLLGKTQLQAMHAEGKSADATWCPRLNETLGTPDCAKAYGRAPITDVNGLTASPMEMQMAGIPFGALPLTGIKLRNVTPAADAPYLSIILNSIDLYRSDLGSVRARAITPNRDAVIDCSKVSGPCNDVTLYEAKVANAIRAGATLGMLGDAVGDFTFGRLVAGLLPADDDPYGRVSLPRLGILPYAGPGTSNVEYHVNYTAAEALPDGTKISVKMPSDQFTYVLRSTTVTVNGAPGSVSEPQYADGLLTWDVNSPVPAGGVLLMTFRLRPGLQLGTFAVPLTRIAGVGTPVQVTRPSAPIKVVESLESPGRTNDTPATATPIAVQAPGSEGQLVVSHISGRDDRDFFSFSADPAVVPAGSRISVYLDHLATDLDLALMFPAGVQPEAPLRVARALPGAVALGDVMPRIESTTSSIEGNVQSDIDFPDGLSLAGVSQHRHGNAEVVTAIAPKGATPVDRYTVVVMGYNGAFSNDAYSLRVVISRPKQLPSCPARSLPAAVAESKGTMASDTELAGARTLFLVAPTRMQRVHGIDGYRQVMSALGRVTADAELAQVVGKSAVLQIDWNEPGVSGKTDIQAAYDALDANPCDPDRANNLVRAINALVDRRFPGGAALNAIVLVGGDHVIPMSRVDDLTIRTNEIAFVEELARSSSANNALVGALARSKMLSDDAFGLAEVVRFPGTHLYVPTVALGRLVEQPSEIAGALDRFAQFDGKLDPKTALTTGAEGFLEDLADDVDAELSRLLGANQPDLIRQQWGLAEFKNSFTAKSPAPDIVSFNGHSDPARSKPKLGLTTADLFSTNDILAGSDLINRLIFSAGCHTGLIESDVLVSTPEFSQAFARKGVAGNVGQSGYGLGSISSVALTERLMVSFAKGLGSDTVGGAHMRAKHDYVANVPSLDVFDLKALMASTFFGIPSARLTGARITPYSPPNLQATVDARTGAEVVALSLQSTDPTAAGYYQLQQRTAPDGTGSYFTANGGAQMAPDRPIQPAFSVDVTRPGKRAHGVFITGAVSDDSRVGFDPVITGITTVSSSLQHAESQPADVVFPSAIQAIRSTMIDGTPRDYAAFVPGLFISSGYQNGKIVGRQRLYTKIDASVLHCPASDTDFTPPVISSAEGIVVDGVVSFVVNARSTVPADDSVTRVVVVYREAGQNVWRSLDLLETDVAGRFAGGVPITATKAEFIVQASDEHCNVATSGNKGLSYEAVPPPSAGSGITATIMGDALENGWFSRATAALKPAAADVVVHYRVNGGRERLYEGPISFAGDGIPGTAEVRGNGHHVLTFTGTDGSRGAAVVRIDNRAPTITITSPRADGSSAFKLRSTAPRASFFCADSGSGLRPALLGCSAKLDGVPIANGDALTTSTPGFHTLTVTAKDIAGHEVTRAVVYQVVFEFEGFLSPLKNRPFLNKWNAGQNVPVKWRLRDATGAAITDLGVVQSTGSFEIVCPSPPPISNEPGTVSSGSTLNHNGDHYLYSWATLRGVPPTGWQGTCRRFVLILSDKTVHVADFAFS